METLERYGTEAQKQQWLQPLLEGKIRSAFIMTEPKVASSDATNIESSIVRDGDSYVINGHKWWSSGIGDPRCKILIFMGKTDPNNPDRYKQQSMILVPRDTPGLEIVRHLPVFGYQDQHGHSELRFTDVRVPASNLLAGEGGNDSLSGSTRMIAVNLPGAFVTGVIFDPFSDDGVSDHLEGGPDTDTIAFGMAFNDYLSNLS